MNSKLIPCNFGSPITYTLQIDIIIPTKLMLVFFFYSIQILNNTRLKELKETIFWGNIIKYHYNYYMKFLPNKAF